MNTDSHAVESITSRRGMGRVRRIEVRELWTRGRVAKGEKTSVKVKGKNNQADCLTKLAERHEMDEHTQARGVVRKSGRRELCPYSGD